MDTPDGSAAVRLRRRVTASPGPASRATVALRIAAGAGVAVLLISGLSGGLRRAGLDMPLPQAASAHAALMLGSFFAAVIGVERAVALHTRWAWLAPVSSAAGGIALLVGAWSTGAALMVVGAALFVAASVEVLRRQRAAHTVALLMAALCGLAGALRWSTAGPADATAATWLAFLVLTIAAERLEMTRLMRRRPAALPAFGALVTLMLTATLGWTAAPRIAAAAYGLALTGLGLWLVIFDIARVTLHTRALSRYMAVALLAGYAWLALGGLAWMGLAAGLPVRDAAVHAVALGFVFSMVMAHAPVILPAVAGVKVAFEPLFYAPLALLHASLALRLLPGMASLVDDTPAWPAGVAGAGIDLARLGAALNAAALLFFALALLRAAWRWRRLHTG